LSEPIETRTRCEPAQARASLPRRWQRSLRSLPSRFIGALLFAVLSTSLAVTWLSIEATRSFLQEKTEQEFAAALSATGQRIELWHAERELELDTISRSSTLAGSLSPVTSGRRGKSDATPGHRYLSLVLEQLPQYRALFVLDQEGNVLSWVGEGPDPGERYRERLATVAEPSVGVPRRNPAGKPIHVVSAPIPGKRVAPPRTVHGILREGGLDELLASASLGPRSEFFVVRRDHSILAPRHPAGRVADRHVFQRSGAADGDSGGAGLAQYTTASGVEVVGETLPLARYGWTLVVEEPYSSVFAPVVAIVQRTVVINAGIILLFSTLAFFAARSIVRPVHALSEAAREIADGNLQVEIPVSSSDDEIGILTGALGEMISRLRQNQIHAEQQNEMLEIANKQLEELSITDGLTGLYNHRHFQSGLERESKRVARSGEPMSLILIDVDDFKAFNDRHGHTTGDEALRRVAQAMRAVTRESDLLARYGGEEFALLTLRNPLDKAIRLAENVRQAVSEVRVPADASPDAEQLRVTASFGVAEFDGDAGALFDEADKALYAAKAGGKNCVVATNEL
jgi:diguanylate cyclase (GGDEF)-like protein